MKSKLLSIKSLCIHAILQIARSAPEEQLDRIPFDLKPGDRVTFTLDRLADDEGLHLGSLSVHHPSMCPSITAFHKLNALFELAALF